VILRTQDEMERGSTALPVAAPPPRPAAWRRAAAWLWAGGWPVLVYSCSRLLLLAVAGVTAVITHHSLAGELSAFDGQWYLRLARDGYPARAVHAKSTLGFLPLYPLAILGLAAVLSCSPLAAALIIAGAGGLAAAVLVQRIARIWWGEQAARRAVVAFCLFPGAVVFSMAYSEGLTLPLVLGCLLALRSRRWLLAGLAAGLAGAVEPAALVLVPVCLAVALRYLWLAGWRDRAAWRSLAAPLLSVAGIAAFGGYLWARTGTPFASFEAQHYGWHQGDPFALLSQPLARHLIRHPGDLPGHLANFSLWNGVAGTVFFLFALAALARVRHELTPGAMLWTCGIGVLTLWSVMSLTNARMLLIAFPAVIVWARTLPRRRFGVFLAAEAGLLVVMAGLTFSGLMLP
jgi:hypothetical protein